MRHRLIVIATALTLALPTVAVAEGTATYTVSAGDSLWLIADQHDMSIKELVDANGLSISSTIHPGQVLSIPGRSSNGADGGPSRPTADRYTIRPDDSLWSVAERYGFTLRSLLASSGLSVNSVIHPGQAIALPGGASSSSGSSTSSSGTGAKRPSATPGSVYVVHSGDSITVIARRLGVSVRALLAANALSRSAIIYPGQRLTVPEATVPKQVASSDHLVPMFERAAVEAGIPTDLLMAVAYVESRWNQSARSAHGAVGVGQLMPRTAAWVARDLMGEPGLDITDSADNIRVSAHLLAWLLDEGGSADRALAMYLQGVYGVRANGVSAAAVGYAAKVTVARRQFR